MMWLTKIIEGVKLVASVVIGIPMVLGELSGLIKSIRGPQGSRATKKLLKKVAESEVKKIKSQTINEIQKVKSLVKDGDAEGIKKLFDETLKKLG